MKPLTGERVIDLTQNVAGPYCTQVLADLGANVIKIERPQGGDDTRQWAPQIGTGMSPTYATLNRGKRSLVLDLDHAEGQALLRRLLRPTDVLIHSLKPGSAEQRGLGYDDLAADRPGLIYCALSAFGTLGPLAPLPGYDPLIQAYAGIMSVTGHEGAEPARVGVSLVDMGTGLWSALGIVAAIARRKDTGRGVRVDTSLLETGVAWMTNPIANYSVTGKLPRRLGSATAMLAPYEVLDTADSRVFVGCGNDRLFAKLAHALGQPDLYADARFATNANRVEHRVALKAALEAVTRTLPSTDVVTRLRGCGVPVSAVHDLEQVLGDAQVQALGLHRTLHVTNEEGLGVETCAVGLPIRFDGEREFAPELSYRSGQDSRTLLRQLAMSDADIDRLAAQGVVNL
jgi:crotonobetainyl-CoA:carnitine CoA-transferase CaiB-like acyl-CoA transferase